MKSIIAKQAELQSAYSTLSHYDMLDPGKVDLGEMTVGEVYEYILKMKRFLDGEIEELLLELSDGDRAIHKPWSVRHKTLLEKKFVPTDETRGEAVDCLCFLSNILLVSGLNAQNIDTEYDKVFKKNKERQSGQY